MLRRFLLVSFTGGGWSEWLRPAVVVAVCSLTFLIWLQNFVRSPVWDTIEAGTHDTLRKVVQELEPGIVEEKMLAEAYWFRYPDVRKNDFWGEDSPMGIRGPRVHYRRYGRREGRLFAPIIQPPRPEAEKELAEAYWQRYQDVANSDIWGREGSMGMLGARDHYHYYGRAQGRVWGAAKSSGIGDGS